MSESTKAPGMSQEVRTYVQSVRAALADLTPEEVEDLTGGMEADLTELLTERGGSLPAALGTPKEYAAELRQAAGLPEAVPRSGPTIIDVDRWWAGHRASVATEIERSPWLKSARDFAVAIRPAWWVLRGLVAAWVLVNLIGDTPSLLPNGPGMFLVGIPMVIASVVLGRRTLTGSVALAGVRLVNIIAIIALPIAVGSSPGARSEWAGEATPPQRGLSLGGSEVRNVYGYGPDGQRLTGIRLFDDQGATPEPGLHRELHRRPAAEGARHLRQRAVERLPADA